MSAPLANGNAPADMAGSSGSGTGRRVITLDPLCPSDVPTHPELKDVQTDAPSLKDFIRSCYAEAVTELGKVRKGIGETKDKVDGVGVVVKKWKTEEDGLTWFGRTSEHEEGRPVSFEGLNACLMRGHEAHEAEYTPAIYDVNSLLEWECGGLEVDVGEGQVLRDVEMRITQMHHSLPGAGLLSDRCFSVLLLAFSITPTLSLNMQIPIKVPSFPAPIKSRSHLRLAQNSSTKYIYHNDSPDATPTQTRKTKSQKEVIQGSYVSVERIRLVEREGKEKGVIEWDMKTASDAGGKLPGWAQKMGVPGAIVKDVPLALKFTIGGRDG